MFTRSESGLGLPHFFREAEPVLDYDISQDEKEVVFTTVNGGESEIWLAPLDRRSAPRKIVQSGDEVSFGSDLELIFRVRDKQTSFLYRVNRDGTGRAQLTNKPITYKYAVSPDGEWVAASTATTPVAADGKVSTETHETVAIPVHGDAVKKICARACRVTWSSDGKFFYTTGNSVAQNWAAFPLAPGQMLPNLADTGIDASTKAISLNVVVTSQSGGLAPGPDPSTYAFEKTEIRSNLFRIPLH